MSKKYRLLKDLPDYKAGSVIEFCDETGYYRFIEECPDGVRGQWPPQYVDNNPTWFELINERIEVISVRFCILPNENSVEINFDKKIKVSQFPLIKQAVEKVLNDEKEFEFSYEYRVYDKPMYTLEQLEAAFNAARYPDGSYYQHPFPDFKDYLEHLKLQQNQP